MPPIGVKKLWRRVWKKTPKKTLSTGIKRSDFIRNDTRKAKSHTHKWHDNDSDKGENEDPSRHSSENEYLDKDGLLVIGQEFYDIVKRIRGRLMGESKESVQSSIQSSSGGELHARRKFEVKNKDAKSKSRGDIEGERIFKPSARRHHSPGSPVLVTSEVSSSDGHVHVSRKERPTFKAHSRRDWQRPSDSDEKSKLVQERRLRTLELESERERYGDQRLSEIERRLRKLTTNDQQSRDMARNRYLLHRIKEQDKKLRNVEKLLENLHSEGSSNRYRDRPIHHRSAELKKSFERRRNSPDKPYESDDMWDFDKEQTARTRRPYSGLPSYPQKEHVPVIEYDISRKKPPKSKDRPLDIQSLTQKQRSEEE